MIEEWTLYLWGSFMQWSLILWHWTTDTWDRGYEWGIKTLRAIENAHKENTWVFMDRNYTPLLIKDIQIQEHYNNKLVFNESTNTLLLHNRLADNTYQSFDCVDVRVGQENITSFFMNLRWKQGAAPSLIECILLYGILSHYPLSREEISTKLLTVLDSDANEHEILLGSEVAKRRFVGWV